MPTAITQAATSPSAGNEAELTALLGDDAPVEEVATDQENAETQVETPETEEHPAEEQQTEEETATETSEEEVTEEAEQEVEEEETELAIDEKDRDYSDAAYQKAADHFARTKKVTLDPNDPTHRALLKELIDRGEAIKAMKSKAAVEEKPATEEAAGKTETEAPQPQVRQKPTPEQVKQFLTNAETVAKQRLIPEVALNNATKFIKALYAPNLRNGDEIPDPTQEDANALQGVFHEMFLQAMEDILPDLQGSTRNYLSSDPVFGAVERQAVSANALEVMDGMKDAAKKPLYPDLEEMVDSGSLRKALNDNPQISSMVAGNGRDPVANQVLRLQTAYKIARGESVNISVSTVTKAVDTGKKQAEQRAKKLAAGRVGSGTPRGLGKGPSQAQQFVSDLTGGTGSRFSAAIAAQRKR